MGGAGGDVTINDSDPNNPHLTAAAKRELARRDEASNVDVALHGSVIIEPDPFSPWLKFIERMPAMPKQQLLGLIDTFISAEQNRQGTKP